MCWCSSIIVTAMYRIKVNVQKYTDGVQLCHVMVNGCGTQNYNCLIKVWGNRCQTGNKCLRGIRTGNTHITFVLGLKLYQLNATWTKTTFRFAPVTSVDVLGTQKIHKHHSCINFMVPPCINNTQHFIFQLMHTTLKNVQLLEHFKIRKLLQHVSVYKETIIREPQPVLS